MAGRVVKLRAGLPIDLVSVAYAVSGAENWLGTTSLGFEVIAAAGGLPDIVPRQLSPYVSAIRRCADDR
jgi:hypothetical protein